MKVETESTSEHFVECTNPACNCHTLARGEVPLLVNATPHEPRTIDITPTWSGILPALLALIENGTPAGQAMARTELARMAKIADDHVAANG